MIPMVLTFEKPERICITDRNGSIVRLNDRNRTECRFNACERLRARKILNALNEYHSRVYSAGPYRMMPLIEQ